MEKPATISARQFFIKKAIEIARVETKDLEDYSNRELEKISNAFLSPKILAWKDKLGEAEYRSALNSVCFIENEDEELSDELELDSSYE